MRTSPPLSALVTSEDLHQRRFAGAVLAEQAVDTPGLERKAHAMQHANRPERLDDLAEFDGNTHRPARSPFTHTGIAGIAALGPSRRSSSAV